MRTITLELLRHGPAHNQLLSPVTQYLALCESDSAVTIRVPFEHNQMLYRLHALGYAMGEESRQFQMKDTAQVLGELLAGIPGFTAAVNRMRQPPGESEATHLRLILSASELALLPFELALAPPGCPGTGQPLLLQSQMRLCITRETRRTQETFVEWPDSPRILFVYASPPGYELVPARAHLLALRRALEPWIALTGDEDQATRQKLIARHLAVVGDASIESLEEACATGNFTHIHILAHGNKREEAYDRRFGLALHDPRDPLASADVVSGERIATALRVAKRGEGSQLSCPAVVTLASCNSGNVGGVTSSGASIGHALHEANIPLVIVSQFPLSYGGSVRMVEVLYGGLLWGEDPRELLINLRRTLHVQFPASHDWASITGYASLPPNFEQQIASAQIRRTESSINEALRVADAVTRRFSVPTPSSPATLDNDRHKLAILERTSAQVASAKGRLRKLVQRYPAEQAKISALLASSEKREAQIQYARSEISTLPQEQRNAAHARALSALELARDHYWDAFQQDRANYWSAIQFLSLTVILQICGRSAVTAASKDESIMALWTLAEIQSLEDMQRGDLNDRVWALGNLIELYLLAPLIPRGTKIDVSASLEDRARELASMARQHPFGVFSTRRQVTRYIEWYDALTGRKLGPVIESAQQILKLIPLIVEPDKLW